MNIWSLQKDDSIKHLLLLLENELPASAYVICNTSSIDFKSIRLCHSIDTNMCVYIYTYGHEQDRYGVHLEYTTETDIEFTNTMEIIENISYGHLIELLKVHFEISEDVLMTFSRQGNNE